MTPPPTLRVAGHEDEPFLREMVFHALYVRPGNKPFHRSILDQRDVRHYFDGFGGTPGDLGVVATFGIERIGACWARLLTGDDRGYGWVSDAVPELSIALLASHRGQGLGTNMIEVVLHLAADHGFKAVSLSVDAQSPARRLYERMDFEPVGRDATSITMERATT